MAHVKLRQLNSSEYKLLLNPDNDLSGHEMITKIDNVLMFVVNCDDPMHCFMFYILRLRFCGGAISQIMLPLLCMFVTPKQYCLIYTDTKHRSYELRKSYMT